MNFLRALVVSCLVAAVPATALAGLLDRGHCQMQDASAQGAPAPAAMDHSMHAGHAMDDSAAAQVPADGTSQAPADCDCGCDCSGSHCASSATGFLGGDVDGSLVGRFADRHALPVMAAHVAAAHHLDLIRPPALA